MPELGKYAAEVLSAYAATVVLISGLIVLTVRRSRKVRKALEEAERRTASG